ncbi:cell division protein ZapA [Thalassobacillus hwangdonensis]|uniref:Cell division protein ZapA n=1 Tax=Thalassobacillus hwangdonensis TaxID=546108 RepID=A0ABW3L0S7_9BACI
MSKSEDNKSRITVEIHNRPYTIVGNEQPHRVRMVASLVDQKMHEIHEANNRLDTTKLAVLTAVNTMNDYIELKEQFNELLDYLDKLEEKERGKND